MVARFPIIVLGCLAAASLAGVQVVVDGSHTFNGDAPGDYFGFSVSGAGDVNNDGFDDIIVGAYKADNNGDESGSATVFSGATGAVLYTWNGDSAGDLFGFSVSGAGDVNNDGFPDLVVGAQKDDNNGSNSGSARVFSGATGAILYTFNGDGPGDEFGYSVSGAGDVNNDGFDDVIVGAWGDDNNGADSGSATVFSGATGLPLYIWNGDGALDEFGTAVSGAGDVNNDGFDDVIAGIHLDDNNGLNSGSARVLSGATGAILYTFYGDSADDRFGVSVSGAGDVNNDGFDDLIVGAVHDDNNGSNSGSARVFSGATGAILYTFNGDGPDDTLGTSVDGAGDVNNDGFDDLIVGARNDDNNGTGSGSARVFSGETGAILYTFNGDGPDDTFGTSVAGAGDINNDGLPDLIVGAPLNDNSGTDSGSVRLFFKAYSPIPVPNACAGDADHNHAVAFADITSVLANFGLPCPPAAPLPLSSEATFTFSGDGAGEFCARVVSGAGDVNNDGFDDVIVGCPDDATNGTFAGKARVLSGSDGAILYTLYGGSTGKVFGGSVSGVGDLNHDGFDDFVVGALGDNPNGAYSGSARVFSGATGAILYTFNGDGPDDRLGCSVAGAGDVNNDGYADLIVGAYGDGNNGAYSGSARVFSGTTGAILYTFNGDSPGDRLGYSVSGAGDVNGDGFADLIVGAPFDDNNGTDSGSARVFSGATGVILYTWYGEVADDQFGISVSGAGDVNNDGFDDLIVGAWASGLPAGAGSARVFSGATGEILHTFFGGATGDRFGASVSGAGDVNLDGYADLVVGAPADDNNGISSGSVSVFSGATGALLFTMNGDGVNDELGYSVRDAGDVNNDGIPDLIAGAPYDDNNGSNSGSARVFFKAYSYIPQPTLCPGDANSSGAVNFADITSVLANFGIPCP